jgi:hypothetical protein
MLSVRVQHPSINPRSRADFRLGVGLTGVRQLEHSTAIGGLENCVPFVTTKESIHELPMMLPRSALSDIQR